MLAPSGVVSLLTDGPVARPGHVTDRTPLNTQSDHRPRAAGRRHAPRRRPPPRAAWTSTRGGSRYVGHSYNASVGGILSGHRPALRRLRPDGGRPVGRGGPEDGRPTGSTARRSAPEKFDAFVAAYAWADPGRYVAHAAPAVVFLQYATRGGLPQPGARPGVRRPRQRAEALRPLRGAARAERRGPARPDRVPLRAALCAAPGLERDRRRSRPAAAGHRAVVTALSFRASLLATGGTHDRTRKVPARRVPHPEGLVQHQRGHAGAADAGPAPGHDGAGDARLPRRPLPDEHRDAGGDARSAGSRSRSRSATSTGSGARRRCAARSGWRRRSTRRRTSTTRTRASARSARTSRTPRCRRPSTIRRRGRRR